MQHKISAFREHFPNRVSSQIRSDPSTLPSRKVSRGALDKGAWVDIEGTIASRRCPTCLHFCTEDEFYSGKALLAHISKRGELRSVLVHKNHLANLRENAHINKLEEIAEPLRMEAMRSVPPPAKLLPHFLRPASGSALVKGKLSRGIGNPHYVRKSGAE